MPKADVQQKLQTAFSLHQAGELHKAAHIYREIIKTDANNGFALHYLGTIEASLGNFEKAKSVMGRSVAIQPQNMQFIENYASVLFKTENYESALQTCEDGLRFSNANVSLLYISAISLFKLKRLQESLVQFDKILLIQPHHIVAINERGSVLAEMGQYDAALANIDKALALQPHHVEAYLNKANLCGVLKRYDEAIAAFDKAIAVDPNLAAVWQGRGKVLRELKRYDDALAAYDKALALEPDLAGAWLGRGNVFFELARYSDALAAYDKVLALNPDLTTAKYAETARLSAKMQLCDWSNFDADCKRLVSSINKGIVSDPFALLAVSLSPDEQLTIARLFSKRIHTASEKPIWQGERYDHNRIRIAYLSADFRDHPVSYLMASVFEKHDRKRFEPIAISLGPNDSSEMRRRTQAAFEQFIDVGNESDVHIARLLRTLEIDIAVDLMGHTRDSRTAILAHRPAPIQVNYLGYPATMGADYIDYLIADPILIPAANKKNYSEKIIYLPHSYMPGDSKRPISERDYNRADFGLPQTGFVFCCFNNSYKLNPHVFTVWMKLLKTVDGSVLWLSETNSTATSNLRKAASDEGVNPDRLIFARRLSSSADHLARHRLADLFLDTFPYNAHTTASDALWSGLPVLTKIGETFAGRVAASLLNAVGLSELITPTPQEYIDLAIDLATNPEKLAAIKRKLANNRLSTPLFDTESFTRCIETAYLLMYERHQANLAPDDISVPPQR